MHADAILYTLIAVCGALTAAFGSDDAAKYVTPEHLFWLKTIFGSAGAGMLALKMYRSTAFADWQARKNGNGNGHVPNGNTDQLTKS